MEFTNTKPETVNGAAAEKSGSQHVHVQAKLTVGSPDDRYEHEADAVADQVMRMPEPATVQRKCAHCEQEEELQRKPLTPFIQKMGDAGGTAVHDNISHQINTSRGSGNAMPTETRSFMETRFGNDFSNVRIHTGPTAVQLSHELHAQAFTVGNDVYFNEGKFSPGSDSGKRLLAHELTHTIQQSGGEAIQRDGEAESSIRTETPSAVVHTPAPAERYDGSVRRDEYESATTQASNNPYHTADVNVRFDPTSCTITIPHTVMFVNHDASHPTQCGDVIGSAHDPVRAVSETRLREVANRFLRANNEGLNDWFRLRVTNSPNTPCDGRNIPIRVEVTEVAANPDTTVVITGNSGRSYVSGDSDRSSTVLCDSPDDGVLAHEAGHMTLGTGDEYSERSYSGGAPRERLTDSSLMAQVGPVRLQQLHERHFDFVTAFMRQIYPTATMTLIYGDRSRLLPSINPTIGFGGFGGQISGEYLSLGLDMGIPLDVLRRTEIQIGPRVTGLLGLDPTQNIRALLTGLRVGINGTFNTRMFNQLVPLGVGLHLEGGVGHSFDPTSILPENFPYAEMGGSFGYHGPNIGFGAEAAAGTVGGRDSQSYQFFSLGLQFSLRY